jgi:hypothetical protein
MTVATICYNHASHPNSTWRSNTAAALLEAVGFGCVFNIVDGTKGWRDLGFPVLASKWPESPPQCSAADFFEKGKEYAHVGGFEAAPVVGGAYCDTEFRCTHLLGTHADQPVTTYAASSGTDLGFSSYFAVSEQYLPLSV